VGEQRRGLSYGLGAYLLWGLFPLYWKLLEPSGPLEILAQRVLWSLAFVVLLLVLLRRISWFRNLSRRPRALAILTVAAVVIGVNWFTYIYGVNTDRVVETSLGYFITPLFSVLLGVVVLHERLRPTQWGAVAIGALAVIVLTVDYGQPPWIAFTLAVSFGTYGLLKKKVGVPALEGLAVECAVLAPLALGYVLWLQATGDAKFGHVSVTHAALMIGSGVVTAIPLLLFAGAANRIPLTTVGVLQYIAPVLQFAIGVLLLHESMPPARWIGFGLVWLALAIFTVDGLRNHRRQLAEAAPALT
jgi:chloramphenicol-sensitive protein RarD